MERGSTPLTRRRAIGLVAAGGLLLAACGGAVPSAPTTAAAASTPVPAATAASAALKSGAPFNLGFVPGEDAEEVLKRHAPVVAHLKAAMDLDVKGFVGTDYTATIEAMRARKVDAAFFGPFSYVLAAEVANARILVMRGNPDGTPGTYKSLIVASKKSGITSLEGLRGRAFAFVDPASTSGHLIPRATLVRAGLDPDKEMKPIFAGGHDASLLAVNGGKVDAGAVSDTQYKRMVEGKLIDEANVAIIATSDPIPSSPFATRGDLEPALRERLKVSLLGLHVTLTPELARALLGGEKNRYIEADDRTFDPLRETATILKLDLSKIKE